MNTEIGKLYGDLMNYVYQYIPSDGDGRLECEGKLHLLIKSLKASAVSDERNRLVNEIELAFDKIRLRNERSWQRHYLKNQTVIGKLTDEHEEIVLMEIRKSNE